MVILATGLRKESRWLRRDCPMRKTREILRHKWLLGRGYREVARSVDVSLGAVWLAVQRATEAGLDWRRLSKGWTTRFSKPGSTPARRWPGGRGRWPKRRRGASSGPDHERGAASSPSAAHRPIWMS